MSACMWPGLLGSHPSVVSLLHVYTGLHYYTSATLYFITNSTCEKNKSDGGLA